MNSESEFVILEIQDSAYNMIDACIMHFYFFYPGIRCATVKTNRRISDDECRISKYFCGSPFVVRYLILKQLRGRLGSSEFSALRNCCFFSVVNLGNQVLGNVKKLISAIGETNHVGESFVRKHTLGSNRD